MRPSVPFLSGPFLAGLVVVLLPATPTLQALVTPLTLTSTHTAELGHATTTVDRMRRQQSLAVIDVVADPLVSGRAHQRFAQYHDGVRVLGAGVVVQTNRGATTSIFGRVHPEISVPVAPALSSQDAARIATRDGSHITGGPTLAVAFDDGAHVYRLVYQVFTFGPSGLTEHHIDAVSGAIVVQRVALHTQGLSSVCADCAVGVGLGVKGDEKKLSVRHLDGRFRADDGLRPSRVTTYDLQGDWDRAFDVLVGRERLTPADLASDVDNTWEDGAAVDTHAGLGWTLDYLSHRFGRAGLDGNNGPVVALVHPVDRADFFTVPGFVVDLFFLNAFFCRTCGPVGTVVFGEGLPPGQTLGGTGQTLDFFSAGIDIVAHELGHAVIEFTSNLVYQDESGALNEAFSDLLGVGTEFFMAETGRHAVEQADYIVGEDVIKPAGIRSLANPRSRGDPDHYSLRFQGNADNGGVHTNSTIATHAYYLAVEGGTNATSGIAVTGLGPKNRDVVEQIFYRAFVFLLPENATFSMARAATLQSARDLGVGDEAEQVIATAWTAVGVE